MKLAEVPFKKIESGTKTVESRLYDEKRRGIALGDTIEFSRNDDPSKVVTKTVSALHLYPSFRALMTDLPAEKFGWETSEEAIEEIDAFYSQEDQEKFGVVGIGLS